MLYESGAYLLEGRVERDPRRGFSFVVGRIEDLGSALRRADTGPAKRSGFEKSRKAV